MEKFVVRKRAKLEDGSATMGSDGVAAAAASRPQPPAAAPLPPGVDALRLRPGELMHATSAPSAAKRGWLAHCNLTGRDPSRAYCSSDGSSSGWHACVVVAAGGDSARLCAAWGDMEGSRNVGAEAHVYLGHLLRHAHNGSLPDVTLFAHEGAAPNVPPLLHAAALSAGPRFHFAAGASHPCLGGHADCGRNFCWAEGDLAPAVHRVLSLSGRGACPSSCSFPCTLHGSFAASRRALQARRAGP